MRVYGRTDVGRVRESNQDAFVCGTLSDTTLFAVVCDGMGGASGGNIASAIAAKVVAEYLGFNPGQFMKEPQKILEWLPDGSVAERKG